MEGKDRELNDIRASEVKRNKMKKVLEDKEKALGDEEQELEDTQTELESREKHIMERGTWRCRSSSRLSRRPSSRDQHQPSRPFLFSSRIWAIAKGGPITVRGELCFSLSPSLPPFRPLPLSFIIVCVHLRSETKGAGSS
jgi:hypothetical protein